MSKLSFLFGRKTKSAEQKPEPRLSNQVPSQTQDHGIRQNQQRSHRFDPTPYDDYPQTQRTMPYLRSADLEQTNPSIAQPGHGMNKKGGGEGHQPREAYYPPQQQMMQPNRHVNPQSTPQPYDLFEDLSFVQTQDDMDEAPYNNDFEFHYTPRSRPEMYETPLQSSHQPAGPQPSPGQNRHYPQQPQYNQPSTQPSYDPRMAGMSPHQPFHSPQQMYQDGRYEETYPHDPRMYSAPAYPPQHHGMNEQYHPAATHAQQAPYYPNHVQNNEAFEQSQYYDENERYGYEAKQEMQDQRYFEQVNQHQQRQSSAPAQRAPLHSVTSRFVRTQEIADEEPDFQSQQQFYQMHDAKPLIDKHPQEEKFKTSLKLVISITGLVLVTGVVWGTYKWFSNNTVQGPVLITAPSTPLKVRPDTPGGTSFPYQDKLVYDRLLPQTHEKGEDVEKLLPDPEIQVVEPPVYEEVAPVQSPIPTPVPAQTAQPAQTIQPEEQPLPPQQVTQNPAAVAIETQPQTAQPIPAAKPNMTASVSMQSNAREESVTQVTQVQEGNYMVLLGTLPSKEKATIEKQRLQKKFKKHLSTNVLVKSTTLSNGKTAYKLVARQSFPSKEAADSFCKKLDGTSCRAIKE